MKKKLLFVFVLLLMLAGVTSCIVTEEQKPQTEFDKSVELFLENYATKYVNKETIDYNVLASISLLSKYDGNVKVTDYISREEATTYVESLDFTRPTNIFKAAVVDKAFDMVTPSAKTALENLESVDPWSLTYTYIALKYYGVNDTLKQDIKARLTQINPEDYRDADYAGIALIALHGEDVDKEELYNLITPNITKDGISSWGSANSCSTACAILGLLADGKDLSKEFLSEDGSTLPSILMKYEQGGAFEYKLTEGLDEAFATPQCFSAIVCYKIYQETNKPVVLF